MKMTKRMLTILPLISIFFIGGCDNSPEAKEKGEQRNAIDYCWSTYDKKSNSEEQKRFIAGACERMESKFKAQFGVNP